ncbi:MAG TPA: Gfo/Idh/MocA family oxidoreductase [Candidatus Brocadiia bacterium]|nr:Gfo/Idh/MocA family oxidoreductase [Candidatus Brocadiia bacterium]
MKLKFAFAGFRHGHIYGLYEWARTSPEAEIVAAAEDNEATRKSLAGAGKVTLTHASVRKMLDEVKCDVVAVGDYYGARGGIEIMALERGRHVISDKPLCTDLAELDRIESLSRSKGLKVGMMLDMRDRGNMAGLRKLVHDGVLGPIHAVFFGGQHPLMLGSRPGWYFEPGKHGGTINDIAIHAFDAIPWITGMSFHSIVAARCWNAFAPQVPHFKDGGQLMMTLSNGAGVMGDVSYFAPDSMGYTFPLYWRITLWGRNGVAEVCSKNEGVSVGLNGEKEMRVVQTPANDPNGYARAFAADVAGKPIPGALDTPTVLRASRVALMAQRAADQGQTHVKL